jgi:1D-myo-inositol-triphosphate 3-kinase
VSKARYLAYRDSVTSTSSLGFRIDAAVTSKAGTPRGEPLEHVRFSDLKNEVAIRAALAQFLGKSKVLTKALLIKLQRMRTALDRSDFFARHVFVRSSILVTYDELAHTRLRESGGSTAEELLSLTSPAALEVKMIDFAHVHAVPNGGKLTHRAAHRANASEDGYLTGLDSLIATLERVLAEL